MPISEDQAYLVARSTAYDRDGSRIGAVVGIYSDNHTSRPDWVTIAVEPDAPSSSPAPGGVVRFAPLAGGSYAHGRLVLDVTRRQVAGAPAIPDGGEELDADAETRLYRHYGLSPAGDTDVDPASGTTPRAEADGDEVSLLPRAER